MGYTKQEIIDKCEASLKGTYKNNNGKGKTITPSTFYAADFINYIGKTTDTKEYFSDIIAEFVLSHSDEIKNGINQIKRESSYYTQSHKGEYKETSNRLEEIIAMQMFNLSEDGKIFSHIGKIIDYQTPLKDEQGDKAGKIDLLSYDGNTLYLLELKRPDSKETMLRCVLEGFTYLTTVSGAKDKLISDFNKKAGISISDNTPVVTAPLVFLGGYQHKEMNEGRNSVEKLIKQLDIKPFFLAKTDSGFEVFDAEKTKSKSWKKENLNLALKWPNLDFGVRYDTIVKERMVRKVDPSILGGMWNGKEYQHICKELALNFIDGEAPLMADFKGSLSCDKIKYHHGATHLNSSQVMCISFFKKFFEYKKYELLLDVLRKAGIKIEDGAKIEAAAVEYEPNHCERTNFDFYILLTNGKHISFECKFTESEFGGISKTEDTYKYADKWDKTYSALLKDSFYFKGKACDCKNKDCLHNGVLSKSCEKKKTCFIYEFHKYYQINRNILYATDKDDYVIFLTPRENKSLDKERKHIDILAESYGTDHIKNLYWEDLIETTLEVVKDDADLYEYYRKFEYKYF